MLNVCNYVSATQKLQNAVQPQHAKANRSEKKTGTSLPSAGHTAKGDSCTDSWPCEEFSLQLATLSSVQGILSAQGLIWAMDPAWLLWLLKLPVTKGWIKARSDVEIF